MASALLVIVLKKNRLQKIVLLFVLLACQFGVFSQVAPTSPNKSGSKVQIAIILDDVGAKASDAKAFSLSKMVTFSILPHTDFSTDFSYWAAQQNREVMLHMPMESLHQVNLGEGPILAKMYPSEVEMALLNALQTVPHAVGVNNHMGSKLTQMTLQMTTMMEILEKNNMFFIDSRTTRFTKAKVIALKTGVKTARRHIFLDHKQDALFLNQQFEALIAKARKDGKAIGIGHPYPITLKFLKEKLDNLPKDIELITISNYLQETEKFRINPRLVSQQNALNDGSQQSVMLPN